jgi:hypothetical protein
VTDHPFFLSATTRQNPAGISPPDVRVGVAKVEVIGRCLVCECEFVRGEWGRPARYCSSRCKRAVEFRVRKLRAELADAEWALALFDRAPHFAPYNDRDSLCVKVEVLVAKLLEVGARPYARRRNDR